jgi:hypothetical protein
MSKTYTIKNTKNKDAADIKIDANTSEDDLAYFAKLGYDVTAAKKQIETDDKK